MPSVTLGQRLRELRVAAGWTQLALSKALGVSVPSISSWEKGTLPPPSRIDEMALVFAGARTDKPRRRPVDELTDAERASYEGLRGELLGLRGGSELETAGVQSPLKFGTGEAITIVCSKLPDGRRKEFGDPRPSDANYIDSYKYADLDALLELLPFVVALNPTSQVVVGTADEVSLNDREAHLIALGGVDWNPVTADLMRFFEHIPVSQVQRDQDHDGGSFLVRQKNEKARHLTPRLTRRGNETTLVEDVAHFLRAPNPYNRQRTLTIFNGMFSRGSYGVVRALTAPKIQERNAAHVALRLNHFPTYSVVCRVKIVANEIIVPDWTVPDDRLHEWPEAVDGGSTAA
jgi:transcriptional regulator with XRE-family HTH domain